MEQPNESIVWEGNPSQMTNLGVYILCALIAAAIVAAGVLRSEERR